MGTGREGEGVDTDGVRKERDSEREGWRKGMEWAGRQRERERERGRGLTQLGTGSGGGET